MQSIPVLKDGDLYIQNFKTGAHKRVDFPGKIVRVEYNFMGGFGASFLDESGYLYSLELDGSYTQYEDITEVKDFCVEKFALRVYIIKYDGSLLFARNERSDRNFRAVKLTGGRTQVKFDKIYGAGLVIAIDEFGNLWKNTTDGFSVSFFQMTKDIAFVYAEIKRNVISAIDVDGNVYTFITRNNQTDGNKIDIMGLSFIQSSYVGSYLYAIDINHNLWVGNLRHMGPFKIINTNIASMVAVAESYYCILSMDGILTLKNSLTIREDEDDGYEYEYEEEDDEEDEEEWNNGNFQYPPIGQNPGFPNQPIGQNLGIPNQPIGQNPGFPNQPIGQNPRFPNQPIAIQDEPPWWFKPQDDDITFDKLPNIMEVKKKRFATTKSARNFK